MHDGRHSTRHEVVIWRDLSSRSTSHQLARFGRVATALFAGLACAVVAFTLLASSEENPAVLLSEAMRRDIDAALDSQIVPAKKQLALERGWSRAQALFASKKESGEDVEFSGQPNSADEVLSVSGAATLAAGQHPGAHSEALAEESSSQPPTVPSSGSSSLWDFPEIKRYQEASTGTAEEFWNKMKSMKAEHKYSLRWPDANDGDLSWPTGGGGGQRSEVDFGGADGEGRRSAGDASGGNGGRGGGGGEEENYSQQEDGGNQHSPVVAKYDGERGGGGHFVKAGALLHRGDIMPVTRPFVQWASGCSVQICPLDTPHKERAYAWKYCMNHFVTNAEKRYCFQAVLSPPLPPPSCPSLPPPPPHARILPPAPPALIEGSRVRVGASVAVKCEDGYRITGNADPKCLDDTTWEEPGTCQPIICPAPAVPEHGRVEPEGDLEVGEEVRVVCDDGYVAVGEERARCGEGGEVGPLGACEEVTCPPYQPPQHARASPPGRVAAGDHVTVTCDPGFSIVGEGAGDVECGPDGQWRESEGVCEPLLCPPLPAPPHGSVSGPDQVQVGRSVTVQCEPGYEVQVTGSGKGAAGDTQSDPGPETGTTVVRQLEAGPGGTVVEVEIKCEGDQTWAPSSVTCVGYCEPFGAVEHGSVAPVGRVRVGESVQITCDEWYRLDKCDSGRATCGEQRSYDCPDAECKLTPSCAPLEAPRHGRVVPGGRVEVGGRVVVVCDEGFEMEEGAVDSFECGEDGSYGDGATVPLCKPIPECPPYPAPLHGSASPAGVPLKVGDQVQVFCDPGFRLGPESSSIVTCTGTQYDYPLTRCIPLPSCGPYPTVPHGQAKPKGNITEGKCVEITCDEGFAMDPNESAGHEKPCCLMDIVAGRLRFQQGKPCEEIPCSICSDRDVCPHCFIGKKQFPAKRREFNFD